MPKKSPNLKRRLTPNQRIDKLLRHYQRARTTEGKANVHRQIQLLNSAIQKERLRKEIARRVREGLLPEPEKPRRISKEVQQQIAQAADGLDSGNFGQTWNALQVAEKIAKTVSEKQIIAEHWFDLATQSVVHQSSFMLVHLNEALSVARKANDKNLVREITKLAAKAGYRLE